MIKVKFIFVEVETTATSVYMPTSHGTFMKCRCRAYIFPIVKTVPIDVSAHARI